jgi:hypothetical protein
MCMKQATSVGSHDCLGCRGHSAPFCDSLLCWKENNVLSVYLLVSTFIRVFSLLNARILSGKRCDFRIPCSRAQHESAGDAHRACNQSRRSRSSGGQALGNTRAARWCCEEIAPAAKATRSGSSPTHKRSLGGWASCVGGEASRICSFQTTDQEPSGCVRVPCRASGKVTYGLYRADRQASSTTPTTNPQQARRSTGA